MVFQGFSACVRHCHPRGCSTNLGDHSKFLGDRKFLNRSGQPKVNSQAMAMAWRPLKRTGPERSRGLLGRSRVIPPPVADTVTETRAEISRSDLTFSATNISVSAKTPVPPADLEAGQVIEDYTEAYFNEYYEDEQLVSRKNSQFGAGKDTQSDTFQSHVNQGFQQDNESIYGDTDNSSGTVGELSKVTTSREISPKDRENRRDADSEMSANVSQIRVRSQIPEATNEDQATDFADFNSDTLTPTLDAVVVSTTDYDWQQDEVKSDVEQDVQITVLSDANEEIIEVSVQDNSDSDSDLASLTTSVDIEIVSPTDQNECLDNVLVVDVTQKRSGGGDRAESFYGRGFSSVTAFISNIMGGKIADSGSNAVQRSQSMRLPPVSDPVISRARKPLLRELSFSDCDSKKYRNYGSLRTSCALPRRRQLGLGDEGADSKKHIPKFLKSELATHLLNLMQQLLVRGKVRQVAVLEQKNGSIVASLPTWHLTHADEIGLVKSATSNLETMFKISVGKEHYTCFKHGKDKIVCRSGDSVLVAQTTNSCVVVGVANDNIPGSCLYEVSELARTLQDKGW